MRMTLISMQEMTSYKIPISSFRYLPSICAIPFYLPQSERQLLQDYFADWLLSTKLVRFLFDGFAFDITLI